MTHSWQPIDLVDLPERPARLPVPSRLYYPGARHLWSGEPESGKSWAAVIATADELRAGNTTVYLDFEDDEYQARDRFLALGLSRFDLANLIYIRPSDGFGTRGVHETISTLFAESAPTLIVIDAYAGALDIHELDPYKASDIEKFNRAVVDQLRALSGGQAAVIILDHVVKTTENRGRFSIGSERKTGAVDVHLGFHVVAPFGRGRKGLFTINVHKDRPGWLPRPSIGTLTLESDPDTLAVSWQIREAPTAEDGERFRPTALMERVSRYLEQLGHAASRKTITDDVPGKAQYLRAAVDILIAEGYAHEEPGARGAQLASSLKPYREALDTTETADLGTSSPPRPHLVPDEVTTSSPHPPFFLTEGGRDEVGQESAENGSASSYVRPVFASDDETTN